MLEQASKASIHAPGPSQPSIHAPGPSQPTQIIQGSSPCSMQTLSLRPQPAQSPTAPTKGPKPIIKQNLSTKSTQSTKAKADELLAMAQQLMTQATQLYSENEDNHGSEGSCNYDPDSLSQDAQDPHAM